VTDDGSNLARLRRGEAVFGVLQTIPNPTLTELAIWSGFDFVTLDCEHGAVDEQAHLASLQIIERSDVFALVRVRPGDLGAVGRYLDFGADGILMPELRNAAEAAAFVAASKHAPAGSRSSAGPAVRAARYGIASRAEREPPLLLGIIETADAVVDIGEITATPALDGLIIGPFDLSASLGCANDFSAPAYQTAFARIEQAAARGSLLVGSVPHPGFPVARLIDAGHRLILGGVDVLALRDGFCAQLAAARDRKS